MSAGGGGLAASGRIGLIAGLLALGSIVVVGNQMAGQDRTADQLRWLVWGVIALILVLIGSGMYGFVGVQKVRHRLHALDEKLIALRREVDAMAAPETSTAGDLLALDDGETYHRSGCRVLASKAGVRAVDRGDIGVRGLRPCMLCESPPSHDPGAQRASAIDGRRS